MVQFKLKGYFGSKEQAATLDKLATKIVQHTIGKEKQYKGSWMKRGGIGAFMMLARKWDRIEVDAENHEYDIMAAIDSTAHKSDGLLDDINDLISYLLLVKAYYHDLEATDTYERMELETDKQFQPDDRFASEQEIAPPPETEEYLSV